MYDYKKKSSCEVGIRFAPEQFQVYHWLIKHNDF